MTWELNLIALFQDGWDYARWDRDDGIYYGAERLKATHRLICTRWNTFPQKGTDVKKAIRMVKTRPEGYALAVAAIPLRKRPKRRLSHRLKHGLPTLDVPVYKRHGTLEGRRRVLIYMTSARFHAHPGKMKKLIRSLSGERCNALHQTLLRANKQALKRDRKRQRKENQKQKP